MDELPDAEARRLSLCEQEIFTKHEGSDNSEDDRESIPPVISITGAARLSLKQAFAIIENMTGQYQLMARLMLNCGLHPDECIELRVRHIQFDRQRILVPGIDGEIQRASFMPQVLFRDLHKQIEYVSLLHRQDARAGFGETPVYESGRWIARSGLQWQWLFSNSALALNEADAQDRTNSILLILQRRLNCAARPLGLVALAAEALYECHCSCVEKPVNPD